MPDSNMPEPIPGPPATAEPPHRLPPRVRLRLTVAIPLVVTLVAMLSGFLALWISYPLFSASGRPITRADVEQRVTLAFVAVGGFAFLSLLLAVGLARSIARPLRELASRARSLTRGAEEPARPREETTEIDALGSALEGIESSVSSLRLDSYTLRSLEGAVVTIAPDGRVTSFNPVAESILDCTQAAAVGHYVQDSIPEGPANEPFLAAVRAALERSARASSAEAGIRTRQGRDVHLGYSISPLRDEEGRSLGVVLTFKDLAEQKAAEQFIRRTENLALVGTMATNVAHEIRNPLGAVSGLVETARDNSPPDTPMQRYAAKILEYIERINRICQELLTVGNPEPRSIEPLDINRLAQTALETVRYDAANRDIEVGESYAADLPAIPGDGERLGQVLLNILRNACQAVRAVEGNGRIALSTRATRRGVAVDVRNTGPPIPPQQQEKLFTLFYTTKKRGTGLGLAVSQQLVRAHGGRITVDSAPERATTFTIELPAAGPSPATPG